MSTLAPNLQASGQTNLPGLIWTLVRTDFKVRYHGTVMGFLWALLKPVAMFFVLMAIFSFIFPNDPHYKVNLIVGLLLWDFFAEATKVGLVSLHSKGYLLGKTTFPRWVVVLTSMSNPLVTLTVVVTSLLVFLGAMGELPGVLNVLLFLLYLLLYLGIVLGISLAGSVLFLRYRDLNQVWEVATHAGFFVAPVVYPLSAIPERYHFLLYIWPPTPIIQFSREVLVSGTIPSLKAHAMLVGVAAFVLGVGLVLFKTNSPRIAERL
jgi:ABC-type polysaccharide/polyol phosphate export permease